MNTTWLAVLVIALVAFALRVYRLDFVSLRGDEAFTVLFVQRTWEGLWRGISTIEPNPPLMYLALRVWVALAGASEFATRYFSAFFGVLCIPLLYRLARQLFDARVARVAAALIAINPYQIWHSQDVRNYTMWPCLSLLALVFLWQWWRVEIRDWKMRDWRLAPSFVFRPSSLVLRPLSLYLLATLASLYTHYYDTFILTAENIFVFVFATIGRRWGTLARWIGAQSVLVLLYAPWVLFGTNRITTYGEGSAESGVTLLDVFSRTLASFVLSDTVPSDFKAMLWLPFALALLAILVRLVRQDIVRAAFLFLWIAIPTLAQYIVSIGRPLFLERYLNGIAPAYYVAFALGLVGRAEVRGQKSEVRDQETGGKSLETENTPHASRLTPHASRITSHVSRITPHTSRFTFHVSRLTSHVSRFTLPLGLFFFITLAAYALTNYYFDSAYAKAPNWRALMQYIKDQRAPGDFVIQNFTEAAPIYYRGDLPVLTVPRDYRASASDEEFLRRLNAEYRRIWLIPASPGWWDNERFVEKFLSRYAERVSEIPLDIFRLQLYLTPRTFESNIIPLGARVGNATLVGYHVEGTRQVRVTLYWRAAARIEDDLTVFTHIVDETRRVLAQHDGVPAFGWYPTTAWQPGERIVDVHEIRADAAPGTYTLVVGMYDARTLARVPAFDASGARAADDSIILTQITIP